MQTIAGTAVKSGVLALALVLGGCGGGGGGGSPVVDPPVAQRAVQGTAAKGMIKGARVAVHALDAQGVRSATALASATTGADGSWRLQVPMATRSFLIEVSAAAGAVMADEVTGTDLPLPESMKLRSVVTLAENASGSYEGSVTPLTEMIVRTAETLDGKLPQQAVAQAKSHVRTLLGFDPETVKPISANNPAALMAGEDEKNQSLVLAAISKMGSTATADCGQSTPGERIACVVGKLAASVVVKDGVPGLDAGRLAQLRDAIEAVAKDKNINRTGKDKVVGVPVLTPPPGTPPGPVTPPPPVGATPLEATKALFGSLRTNLRAIGEGEAFRATADAIKADLTGTIEPLGNDVAGFSTLAMEAFERLERYRTGEIVREEFMVWNNHVLDQAPRSHNIGGRGDGSCRITQNPLSIGCTVIRETALPGTCCVSNTLVQATRTFTLQPKPGSTRDFTYSAFLEKNVVAMDRWAPLAVLSSEALGGVFSGDISFELSTTATQFTIHGQMPGRLVNGLFVSDGEDWSLGVTRTAEGDGITHYALDGKVTAHTGQSARTVEISEGSFLRVALKGASNKTVQNAANELQLTLRGIVGNTAVGGILRASGDMQDKSQTTRMLTALSFEGALDHGDATVFNGHVALTRHGYQNYDATAPESDTNFVADTIEIGGALSVPDRPVLSLMLGATRTGIDAGALSAQYRDGSSVINASVSAKAGERHPLVKVSSADGVAFSFANTSAPVDVSKDGVVTARLDLAKGLIHYSDGSSESLK